MSGDLTTIGYEAEASDVAALVAELHDGTYGDDPVPLYLQATRLQVLYRAASDAAAAERAKQCARLWVGTPDSGPRRPTGQYPDGLSFQQVADALSLGTRARAQQLVERGRAALKD
jgi:hypothetical protein